MKSIKIIKIWNVLFMLIMFIQFSSAIGLAPSRIEIDFEPYLKQTLTMHVINNENRPIYTEFYVKGDLKDYMKIYKTQIKLEPNEIKVFYVELELPADAGKPGIHDNRIGVVEISDPSKNSGAMIGARAGVEAQVWIKAPHKEKYIETSLIVANAKVGDDIKFTLAISNLGIFDLSQVNAKLKIYDFNDKLIKTLNTETKSLKKQASITFESIMSTSGLSIGKYKVAAVIEYDGLSKEVKADFKIGDFLIKINEIKIAPIEQGAIGEILVHLENYWPDIIGNMDLEFKIKKNGNVIDIIKQNKESINAWESKIIPVYWKSGDNDLGEYNAEVIIKYGDKTAQADTLFEIVERGKKPVAEAPFMGYIPLMILLLVVLGVIIYFLFSFGNIKISMKVK